ncbi:hypothetical protein NMU03_15710 [Allocoprobacillus halotolerans]|uniref:Spore maturation protein A n=1 Tax=Allocoprobacillus halotolerans TaxID=2944914 RepID=A0ABY5I1S9_9FIRM|nr:hypothetical protein [Allocoprobacillus halotolerans]UTY39005.1 hypothetical protein NMU03_15710 [Allocoprobacillus halotolerans]
MARIWKWCVVIFLLIGLLRHQEEAMMVALMDTPYMVWDLLLNVILSACLWGGFLNIIEKTGFMNYLSFLLKPLFHLLYGSIIKDKEVYTYLSSNMIANLLGLGTLATISGLKAFQTLQNHNAHPQYPSRAMLTLVIVNTAGLCLFPSTLFMIRQQMGSLEIYAFYPYMLLIGVSIIVIGLVIQRVIDHE